MEDKRYMPGYQALAMRTSSEGHDRVLNGCMGLVGETGEIVDVIKKWKFQSGDRADLPVDKIVEECGDVLWYCAEIMTGLDANLELWYGNYVAVFGVVRNPDADMDIADLALSISFAAHMPRRILENGTGRIRENLEPEDERSAIWTVLTLMRSLETLLETHCACTMRECMEKNIEKLKKRYPDGFDPERSLNR